MVETIFRVAIILVLITVTLGILGSASASFNISNNFSEILLKFFVFACYLLPIKNLLPIFLFVISVVVFKTTVTIVKTIWNLLPIKG